MAQPGAWHPAEPRSTRRARRDLSIYKMPNTLIAQNSNKTKADVKKTGRIFGISSLLRK
jgi:hypothetical protein